VLGFGLGYPVASGSERPDAAVFVLVRVLLLLIEQIVDKREAGQPGQCPWSTKSPERRGTVDT
jgi:hypothetical protein